MIKEVNNERGGESMDNVTTLAIAKGLKKNIVTEANKKVTAGTYSVDAYIHVHGQIKKGEDKEQSVHMNIPYGKLILSLLSKVNEATRAKMIREAIKNMDGMSEDQELLIKDEVQSAWQSITEKSKQITAGKVTTKLTFDIISPNLADSIEKIEKVVEEV